MARIKSFSDALRQYQTYGYLADQELIHIQIPNAKQVLWEALSYVLTQDGRTPKWIPAYNEVAEWMSDNKGRGLLCIGSWGLGKTVICQQVLPAIIYQYYEYIIPLYNSTVIDKKLEQIKTDHLFSLDDIGTEPAESVKYGERRMPFNEIVDEAEKRKSFMLVSTNLVPTHTVDKTGKVIPSIEDVYGIRTLDRLRSITKTVIFKGPSFRE